MGEKMFIPEKEKDNLVELDFSNVVGYVTEHNKRFSVGSMAAEMLKNQIKDDSNLDADFEDKEANSIEQINTDFEPLLDRAGLNIESVETGAKVFGSTGSTDESEVRFNIDDRHKFITYLHELNSESVSDNQIKGLNAVLESITTQLRKEYELEDPDDDSMIELLGGLEEILDECSRIDANTHGLSQTLDELKRYNTAAQEKHIKELLLVERNDLMLEVGGKNYGPSKWHTDARPDVYKDKWNNAIDILRDIKRSNRRGDFYKELKSHLVDSLTYAVEDMKKKIDAEDNIKYHQPLYELADEFFYKIRTI